MNKSPTKLAIALLTQQKADITSSLAALGLLTDGAALAGLEDVVNEFTAAAWEEYERLMGEVEAIASSLPQLRERLALARSEEQGEEQRYHELIGNNTASGAELEKLKEQLVALEDGYNTEKAKREGEIEGLKDDIWDTKVELADNQQEIGSTEQSIVNREELLQDYQQQRNEHVRLKSYYGSRWKYKVVTRGKCGQEEKGGWVLDPANAAQRDYHDQQYDRLGQLIKIVRGEIKHLETLKGDLEAGEEQLKAELGANLAQLTILEQALTVYTIEYEQHSELAGLKIEQIEEDIRELEGKIATQEQELTSARSRVEEVAGALEQLKADFKVATDALDTFVAENAFLISSQNLEALEGYIEEVTAEIEPLKAAAEVEEIARKEEQLTRLKQHYQLVAQEELETIEERLEALRSQEATEVAVEVALETGTLAAYEELVVELTEQLSGLTGIWIENLRQSHDLTTVIWDEFQKHAQVFEEFTAYVEENLAEPHGVYTLEKVELEEAIQREVAREAYGDRLTETIDSTEEVIQVLELQIEQGEEVAAQLEHIENLSQYEKEYYDAVAARRDDLVKIYGDSQSKAHIVGHLSTGNGFEQWSFHSQIGGFWNSQRWSSGDFNGDGLDDLVNIYNYQGKAAIQTHLSTGNGFRFFTEDQIPGYWDAQKWVVGDFNGDGLDDLVKIYGDSQGKAHIVGHLSTGNGFEQWSFHSQIGGFWNSQRWSSGDFNGDGLDDLVNIYYHRGKAAIQTHLSTGNGFRFFTEDQIPGYWDAQKWVVGDFNGNKNISYAQIEAKAEQFLDTLKQEIDNQIQDVDIELGFALAPSKAAYRDYGPEQGWSSFDKYPRHLADVNGDGRADIVAFGYGNKHVAVSLANEDGTFQPLKVGIYNEYAQSGGWNSFDKYPRHLADVNGDGRADIVAFGYGNKHVAVSLANEDGTFQPLKVGIYNEYAVHGGGWNSFYKHPRHVADVNGDGRADIVGFGFGEVYVSLANENGTFQPGKTGISGEFAHSGGWNSDKYPRHLADVNGDGRADIVGFGFGEVYVSLANENGTFQPGKAGISDKFAVRSSWSTQNAYPRQLADVNGDGRADIVGFGEGRVYIALAKENGKFDTPFRATDDFTRAKAWTSQDWKPRHVADVNGDGRADIVGFGGSEVHVSLSLDENGLQEKEELLEASLREYIQQRKENISDIQAQERAIAAFQDLPPEILHLETVAEREPDLVLSYLEAYQKSNKSATTVTSLRKQYFPELDANVLTNLKNEVNAGLESAQTQLQERKASIDSQTAQITAALSQAQWYEEQATVHYNKSEKKGAIWTEERWYRQKRWWGGSTWEKLEIQHRDHYYIIYETYTSQAKALREQVKDLEGDIDLEEGYQEAEEQILAGWQEALETVQSTELTQEELEEQLAALRQNRELNAQREVQLEGLKPLLGTLRGQLEEVEEQINGAKANVEREWEEYTTSSEIYDTARNDIATRQAALAVESQQLLLQIAHGKEWVRLEREQLEEEIGQVQATQQQLESQLDPENPEVALEKSLQLLTLKETVLTSHKANLAQKENLLEIQEELVLEGGKLVQSFLENPDEDYSNLRAKLEALQDSLIQAQAAAEAAENRSNSLSALVGDLESNLEVENDQYLAEIAAKNQTLQDLVAAAQLKESYTRDKTALQGELNTLESELIMRLEEAAEAGEEEAMALLAVANNQNFATAADIYYRDYQDLTTDNGGCGAGGVARPEDRMLADKYRMERDKYRQLEEEAQNQANHFAQLQAAAQEQAKLIQETQFLVQNELNQINYQLETVDGDIAQLQQEKALHELRMAALGQLRHQTEQTLAQLLEVEKLNFAQVQLEQHFLQQRQEGIDDTVAAQLERDRLQLERQRNLLTVTLEQLTQIQTEEALENALNNLLMNLEQDPVQDIVKEGEWRRQLEEVLGKLEAVEEKSGLPQDIQNLLTQTNGDIQRFLNGEEVTTLQENLLESANFLFEQRNELNAEIQKLAEKEAADTALLQLAATNLEDAAKQLTAKIEESQALGEKKEIANLNNLVAEYKEAYAQGAIELSNELAQQSQKVISQILGGRAEEREIRKKTLTNEILSAVSTFLSIASTILSFTPLAAVGIALGAVSSAVKTAQSIYNGDTIGAIFNGAMTLLNVGLATFGNQLSAAQESLKLPQNAGKIAEINNAITGLQSTIKGLEAVKITANTAYGTYQASKSGDNTLALLTVVQGATNLVNLDLQVQNDVLSWATFPEKFLVTAGQLSVSTYNVVQKIENGESIGIGDIVPALRTVSQNFLSNLPSNENAKESQGEKNWWENALDTVKGWYGDSKAWLEENVLNPLDEHFLNAEQLVRLGSNIYSVATAAKDGDSIAVLQAIDEALQTWQGDEDFQQDIVDGLIYSDDILTVAGGLNVSPKHLQVEADGSIHFVNEDLEIDISVGFTQGKLEANRIDDLSTGEIYTALKELDEDVQEQVRLHLRQKYPTPEAWEEAHPISLAHASANEQLLEQVVYEQYELQREIYENEEQFIEPPLYSSNAADYFQDGYVIFYEPLKESRISPGHAGVISVEDDGTYVIESVPAEGDFNGGIRKVTLYEWLEEHNDATPSVYRPEGWTAEKGGAITEEANYWANEEALNPDNTSYSVGAIFAGSHDDSQSYCTLFVERLLDSQDIGVYERTSYIAPWWMRQQMTPVLNTQQLLNLTGYSNPDPIILDLNNDGIQLISLKDSPVTFDLDNDGHPEPTGWIAPEDAFLAQDRNQDGKINNITELFSEYYSPEAETGLEALATLDSNHDNIINPQDAQYGTLSLWQDRNLNGETDPFELTPLSETDITAINLDSTPVLQNLEGNILLSTTQYTRIDGTLGEAAEVALLIHNTDSLTGISPTLDTPELISPQPDIFNDNTLFKYNYVCNAKILKGLKKNSPQFISGRVLSGHPTSHGS